MSNAAKVRPQQVSTRQSETSPIVGTLQRITADGIPFVVYPGNDAVPTAVRVVSSPALADMSPGDEVLLLFDRARSDQPVIIGVVSDRIQPVPTSLVVNRRVDDVLVDGERIVFEARSEVVLRCGKGSISIRADGKIVVKGTELVSRSSGANKIRGAVVNIN